MDISDDEDSNQEPTYYKLDTVAIEIEEVDSNFLPQSELSQFVSADTIIIDNASNNITIEDTIDDRLNIQSEQEEELIKKLIDGELTFSEYKAQLGRNDEDINAIIEEDEIVEISGIDSINEPTVIPKPSGSGHQDVKATRRKKPVLPPALQGLMGEANLCYARGDNKLAEKVCLEIIRQVPLAPEPFLTLAQIYETSDPDKFMQFSLIAAHLNPVDTDLWLRLSEISVEQGNMKQAITCLTRGINADPKNIPLRLRRIYLLESIGEDKLAFRSYYGMLAFIPKEDGEFLMTTARQVAERFHKENNMSKALEAMQKAYTKVPELFKLEDINILLDLHISNNNFSLVLEILKDYIGLNYQACEIIDVDGKKSNNSILYCEIPNDLILDFRTKLIVSLIHLNYQLIDDLIENALKNIDVEDAGDCHLDIAEALMKEKHYDKALKLLIPLVESQNFSLAAVWLRHADCHRALENIDDAIESYEKVVELAPQVLDARLTLSALLKKKGMISEALKVLEQDPDTEMLDEKLLYERCFVLKDTGRLLEYVNVGLLLISRTCIKLRNSEEIVCVATLQKIQSRISGIKELRKIKNESIEDVDAPEFTTSPIAEVSLEDEWALFEDLVKVAVDLQEFDTAQKLTFYALTSKRFVSHNREIEFYALLTSIFNFDSYSSYKLVKDFIIKDFNNIKLWNLLNLIVQFSEDIRYSRFLMRFLNRIEPNPMVYILQANNCLVAGTYKYALNDYLSIYKKTHDPLLALLCGITFSSISIQKFMSKKPNLIKQTISFFSKYAELRKSTTEYEVNYNFGRLYHQFGMISLAVHYYKLVLNYENDLMKKYEKYLNLKREAAFNLHLIYKTSGNREMARKILHDYVVI